jgi:peptidoglycan/xylan/chitin deacetylase (PgdA/CDA1 family)
MGDRLLLVYHGVSDTWPSQLAVTRDQLRRQLGAIVGGGYRGTTLSDAMRAPDEDRVVAVTFDDAYRSVLECAAPILAELDLPGTVYVPTDFADSVAPMSWPGIEDWVGGPHEHELRCLSWAELRDLAAAGWEVGSHTRSHPHLPELDDDRLRDELSGSRATCEEAMGLPCPTVAYPYGAHDDRVVAAAERAGYAWACALPDRTIPSGRLRLSRVGVYRDEPALRFRAKVSPLVRRIRATGGFEPLVSLLQRG